jgi:hypothetical protein
VGSKKLKMYHKFLFEQILSALSSWQINISPKSLEHFNDEKNSTDHRKEKVVAASSK